MEKIIILYTQFLDYNGEKEKIGGIETYIKNLLNVILESNKEPIIIQFGDINFTKKYNNIKVYGVKNKKKKNSKLLIKKAYEIGNCNEDTILFASSHMNRKNYFKKSISIQHGIYWDVDTVKGKSMNKLITTFLKSFQIFLEIKRNSLVDKNVCVDYNYINWYRSLTLITNEKLYCIPNFASIPYEYKVKNNDIPKIIFARRFEKIRGVNNISNVIDRLFTEGYKFEFTFAGSGTYEDMLKEKYKKNNNVSFITYNASESINVHSKYDIAIVPSIGSEGTSLSLLEAMSAGCCVLSSNVGGMTNIIINGYNGMMCGIDEYSLYTCLKELIRDPSLRNKLSKFGYECVLNSFNLNEWKKQWGRIINE